MLQAAPLRRAPTGELSADLAAEFHRDGFLVLEHFVEEWRCDALRERAEALIAGFDARGVATIFSTRDQGHAASDYFLDSADKVRFFFEEDAFDANGKLTRPKHLAINKIGHGLHLREPLFAAFARDVRLSRIAETLGQEAPFPLQSMYICKQPLIGAEVGWHQDATYLHSEPASVLGFWFALEDASLENGCMLALKGGHKGPLRQRFRRAGRSCVTETLDPVPWPDLPEVALAAPRGSLVLLHGLLPHASGANRSERSRHAFALHVIDAACRYSADNWLQPGPGPA